MKYNPDKHHRRSIRLKGYDYSQPGAYYVTIVVQNRECIFGDISNGKMALNENGKIVKTEWLKTAEIRKNVKLDEFSVMPNHVHGIIIITDKIKNIPNIGKNVETTGNVGATGPVAPTGPRLHPNSLGSIMGQFQSIVTKQIRKFGIEYFSWQRNYWERIIRNKNELNKIRKYIRDNPINWETDDNNPNNMENK